jgi:hypothetical protein
MEILLKRREVLAITEELKKGEVALERLREAILARANAPFHEKRSDSVDVLKVEYGDATRARSVPCIGPTLGTASNKNSDLYVTRDDGVVVR